MQIKSYFLFAFLFFSMLQLNAQNMNPFFQKTDELFKEVVNGNRTNYKALQKKSQQLDELVQIISETTPSNLSPEIRKAFLINAYNLLVVEGVLNNYPLQTTQKVNGFFEKVKYQIGKQSYTLNEIENDLIRKEYNDPRVHFVLNCAAVSCPPITNFAYRPEQLDEQLDTQTRLALNDPEFIYVKNGKNYVSNIFRWYKTDFTEAGSVTDFINGYRTEKLPTSNNIANYPYDWTLNDASIVVATENSGASFIQTYTPSKLLKKGQLEFQLFNNLYTQTAFRNDQREKIDLNQRENYFTGLINLSYGVSENRKWNVGLNINLRSVSINDADSSPLKVFGIRSNDINNRTGISSLGPTIRLAPFKSPNLSIRSTLLIPITQDNEGSERNAAGDPIRPYFDYDRFSWWNQLFFDKNLGLDWQLFLEADLLFRFAKPASSYFNEVPKQDLLETPLSAFLSYFPSRKSTVYVMLQYSPLFGFNKIEGGEKNGGFHAIGDFAQTGLGFKYQVSSKVGLEVSYTNFFTSSSGGAGNTFNLGVRYID